MKIKIKRNTGFYGMGSPIVIKKDGEKWIYLNHNETVEKTIDEEQCSLQVSFFFLKSRPISIKGKAGVQTFEVQMNPRIIYCYVFFFLILYGAAYFQSIQMTVLGIFLFFSMLIFYFRQAYIIKEQSDGN